MGELTYIPPEPPPRPFAKGDEVEVLDRQHRVISRQIIVRAEKRRAKITRDLWRAYNRHMAKVEAAERRRALEPRFEITPAGRAALAAFHT